MHLIEVRVGYGPPYRKSACAEAHHMRLTDFRRNKVVFFNTEMVPAMETRMGHLLQNDVEAELILQVGLCLYKRPYH